MTKRKKKQRGIAMIYKTKTTNITQKYID